MLTDCYLPRLGGIEVQVHDLAARLAERGHDLVVFTATPGAGGLRHGAVEQVDGLDVHRMAIPLPGDLPVNPFARGELRRRLAGVDVAHVHMGVISPFAVDCAYVTTGMGLPTTMTWHCILGRTARLVDRLGVVRRWAARGMAMNAVSEIAAEPLRRIVGPGSDVAVLPNGIDAATWRPASRPARDGTVRIVTAMRLARRKRPLPFLRVARRMRQLLPAGAAVRLEIYGEGPDRPKLERYLAQHRMSDWVCLAGRQSRAALPQRYAAADIYVSPGELESFGIAALEARAAGLPVVGRRGSGIAEFVEDGRNGFLAGTDDEMAHRLAQLVLDVGLRQRMTEANLATPPRQDWSVVTDLAEAEYRRAVAAAVAS